MNLARDNIDRIPSHRHREGVAFSRRMNLQMNEMNAMPREAKMAFDHLIGG
jgi:hypothetical protein